MALRLSNGVYVSSTVLGGDLIRQWFVVDSAYTAVHKDAILADSSGGSFTITLPLTPSVGDNVCVAPLFATYVSNPVTIARNGQLIGGDTQDILLNQNGVSIELSFVGGTIGWAVLDRGQTHIVQNINPTSAVVTKDITELDSGTFNIGMPLPDNSIVTGCKIIVDSAFSGGTPSLIIGSATVGKENDISDSGMSDLTTTGLYVNDSFFRTGTGVDTQIVGTLVVGTGTLIASILIEYQIV